MAGEAKIEEMTREERKQECGCGCGGALCGTARQEATWVDAEKAMAARGTRADQCDCGCGCRS